MTRPRPPIAWVSRHHEGGLVRWATFKRSVIGRPLASEELRRTAPPEGTGPPGVRLRPALLGCLCHRGGDARARLGGGGVRLHHPDLFAIATLLLIVIISYRQTIRAYPDGGGGFIVSLDNLGMGPAMVAGAALLTDYTLTVSVSVSAGVAAMTSALPGLLPWRVVIAVGLVALLTLANLRGVRESSMLFALPTYPS